MRRVIGLENLAEPLPRSAVTIGKFFAVHRGHQALLQATVAAAKRAEALSVAFTFDRHPREILQPGVQVPRLASLEERLDLIEAQGIDATVVALLTPEFLAQEPATFVREVLVERLGVVEILASENFRFGKGARGDLNLLRRLGAELGYHTTPVTPVLEGGDRISSSRVAECVRTGAVAAATCLLGRPYSLPGRVVRGDQVGRQLGFPTANVRVEPDRLFPADGVYVCRVQRGAEALPAVANLGVRPTRDGLNRLLEVHLIDWSGDLYDCPVRVQFLDRLRSEQRFPNLDALRAQIARDVDEARRYFASVA